MTPTPSKTTSHKRKTIIWIGISVLLVSTIIMAVIMLWPEPMPPLDAPREQLVKFTASNRFAKLPDEQKQPYIDAFQKWTREERHEAVEKADLSDEQRGKAFGNTFGKMMGQRIDGYFAITDPKEQKAYLDKMIDEGEARMAQSRKAEAQQPKTADGSTPERRGPGFGDPSRMKGMLENFPPDQRAKMAAFFAAMQDRRKERGLPEWPGPHGGPGGGPGR